MISGRDADFVAVLSESIRGVLQRGICNKFLRTIGVIHVFIARIRAQT